MTEERMIRVVFEDGKENAMLGSTPMGPIWIRKEDTEPAPPSDWRPMCYDSQYNKLNGCDPGHIIVPTCKQCPWLAARHKTEVNRKME